MRVWKWAYGVTSCKQRVETLLPQTLESLTNGGFDEPRLFVDGIDHGLAEKLAQRHMLEVTSHDPPLRAFGNWTVALAELYIRNPAAERYALFQDDCECIGNLKAYLDACPFPERGYWDLFTWDNNQRLAPVRADKRGQVQGWFRTNQLGQGAVGLVFNREGVQELLQHPHMARKPASLPPRAWGCIDGAVCEALVRSCSPPWTEWCHSPSLLQHKGQESTLCKTNIRGFGYRPALGFPGPNFDATEYLRR